MGLNIVLDIAGKKLIIPLRRLQKIVQATTIVPGRGFAVTNRPAEMTAARMTVAMENYVTWEETPKHTVTETWLRFLLFCWP